MGIEYLRDVPCQLKYILGVRRVAAVHQQTSAVALASEDVVARS